MAGFSAELFSSKLSKLSDSQQSIQTLSHWVQFHKKASNASAAAWAAETLRVPPSRQLVFVYLANDIMQNSRRKGPEFIKAFGPQMVAVFPKIFPAATPAVQGKLQRLIGIWEERQVLPAAMLEDIRASIGGARSGSAATGGGASAGSGSGSGTKRPREEEETLEDTEKDVASLLPPSSGSVGSVGSVALADLLMSLDEGSLTDELQAEREADVDLTSLEEMASGGVSDPSELDSASAKTEAATSLLTAHKAKIADELRARRQLILLLASSVERQQAQCTKLTSALLGCETMLGSAQQAAQQVASMKEQMESIAAAASEAM